MDPVQYLPVIIPKSPAAASPQKNLTGPPRIARDIAADLFNNIQKWNSFHITGGQIVKQIVNTKFIESNTFSEKLEDLTNKLATIICGLKICSDAFELLKIQTQALKKLLKTDTNPLFISWSPELLAQYVETVADAYIREFKMKDSVLENIPHARNIDEAMFFAACWVHQIYITNEINVKLEALLTETGHRKLI